TEGFRIPVGIEDELLPACSALKFDSVAVESPAVGITVVAERWPRGIRSEPRWQLPDRAVAALLREPESIVVVIENARAGKVEFDPFEDELVACNVDSIAASTRARDMWVVRHPSGMLDTADRNDL